jgi:hypothetical protein
MTQVCGGRKAAFAQLIDIEGKLGLYVGVWVFCVVDAWPVLLFQTGKLDWNGDIDGLAVSNHIADIVAERANGKRKFVGRLRVVEQAKDKVARADVMGKIREKTIAERVVAKVLNRRAAVSVGMGFLELGFGKGGIVLQQNWANRRLPREIDKLFVALDRVGNRRSGRKDQRQQSNRFKKRAAAGEKNGLRPLRYGST